VTQEHRRCGDLGGSVEGDRVWHEGGAPWITPAATTSD